MFEFYISRHRANTGDASTLSKPSSGLPDTSDKEYFKDDLMTPTNQRLGSDDSGYLSPIRNSDTDPDWWVELGMMNQVLLLISGI